VKIGLLVQKLKERSHVVYWGAGKKSAPTNFTNCIEIISLGPWEGRFWSPVCIVDLFYLYSVNDIGLLHQAIFFLFLEKHENSTIPIDQNPSWEADSQSAGE
jgi:hypothetical protein